MAGAYRINSEFVKYKLDFLEQLQGHVNTVVEDYISKVVSAGKAWMDSDGDQATFLNISQKIDNAIGFLSLKCREISEQLGAQSSAESTVQDRQHLLECETSSQLSVCQVATLSQQLHMTQPGLAETDLLHQILSRVGFTEETISSLHNNMEKVTEQQADKEKKFEDIAAKLLNINKQLSDLSAADKQQNKKLKEHTDVVTEKQEEIQKQQESRLKSLEKIVKKLSKKQDKLEKERCSRDEELERKISDSSELVQCKISDLEAWLEETDSSVTDLLNRVGSQEQVTQSLCTKMDTNIDTLETVSTRQEGNVEILREFEDKLQVIETRVREELEKLGEQFQQTETSLKTVCQLLVNRMEPLEQLRSVLNHKVRTRDDNVRQLQELVQEVSAMSSKLAQLDSQFSTPAVGFTAWVDVQHDADSNSVLTSYFNSSSSDGDHFDLNTGVFTAPVAGTYLAVIRLCKTEVKDGQIYVKVVCKTSRSHLSETKFVCEAVSVVRNVSACDLGVIQMEAGDTLSAVVAWYSCSVNSSVGFSCFMIR